MSDNGASQNAQMVRAQRRELRSDSLAERNALGPVFRDIRDFAAAYQHTISPDDVTASQFCKDNFIPYRTGRAQQNDHQISHICRDEAVRRILWKEGFGVTEMRILDWFGSSRNRRFNPELGPFGRVRVGNTYVSSKTALRVKWVAAPDTPIGGDASRAHGRQSISGNFSFAIVQDIYHDGSTYRDAFTTKTIRKIVAHGPEKVYVCNRMFFGIAGADDFGRFIDPEQVFYRENGLIVSSPDKNSQPYPMHPDTNWLVEHRFIDGIDLTPLQKCGPYHVVLCQLAAPGAQALGPVVLKKPEFVEFPLDVNRVTWLIEYVTHYCMDRIGMKAGAPPPRTLRVHYPTVAHLASKFSMRIPNGQILDNVILSIDLEIHLSKAYHAIAERFPEEAMRIKDGTVFAVLYGHREHHADLVSGLRRRYALTEGKLLEGRSPSTPESYLYIPDWMLTFMVITLAFAINFGWPASILENTRRYYDVILPSHFFQFFILFTLFEEWLRWYNRRLYLLCVIVETMVNLSVDPLNAFGPFMIHVMCSIVSWTRHRVGVVYAAFMHVSYNYLILVRTMETILSTQKRIGVFDPDLSDVPPFWETGSRMAYDYMQAHKMDGAASFFMTFSVTTWIIVFLFSIVWYWLRKKPTSQILLKFQENYALGLHNDYVEPSVTPYPAGVVLPSHHSKVLTGPDNLRGTIQVIVDGRSMTFPDAFALLGESKDTNGVYPILTTNRLLFQPRNCETNLLAAIAHRLHSDPFSENPHSDKSRHARWIRLGEVFRSLPVLSPFQDKFIDNEMAFTLMGKKGARLRTAWKELNEGRILPGRKTVKLKWDETISANKTLGGVICMKPRAIQNLPPEIHAIMAPFARVYSESLHSAFDGQVFQFAGLPVRIFFASGFTASQLSEIGRTMQTGVVVIAVSGDDSVISFGGYHPEGFLFGEADQSAFDHTQDKGPCWFFQQAVQTYMGLPIEFTKLAYKCCASKYTARRGRLFVRGDCHVQMPTGITTTTSYNSMATIAFWLYWLEYRKRITVEQAGERLGFKVKFFARQSIHQATFLKGWWMPTPDGDVGWLPLPSAVLKLGKILRDPVEVTSTIIRGKRQRKEVKEATSMCAFALASSYNGVPDNYPILGAFLAALKRAGRDPGRVLEKLEESWKPKILDSIVIDRSRVLEEIWLRYGIDSLEIEEIESLLSTVSILPSHVEHQAFGKLGDVDY